MSEWISVEDRLPDAENGAGESENVLIFDDLSGIGVGFYCHEENVWADQNGAGLDPDMCVVTHWHPLPSPPA